MLHHRFRELKRKEPQTDSIRTEQWKRQEHARLNALPVSASIIIHPQSSALMSRGGFENEIDFMVSHPFVYQNTSLPSDCRAITGTHRHCP